MTSEKVLTVAEMAKFVGVTPRTVYSDEKRCVVYASLNYPRRFTHQEVTEYRITKVEQFFDRMEEFRGRTKVSPIALAIAFGVDPSLFSHWKRGTSLPHGSTMFKANQVLNGTDREVMERIIIKVSASRLDSRGVAMLNKLYTISSSLPVDDNGTNGTTSAWEERTEKALAEKAKAVEAEKGQHKHKREHTSNVLDSTMRHDIIDWMYRMGKSNSYVARMLGVSSGVVAGWLKGKPINMPNLIKVEALCREQDIPMNEVDVIEFSQPVVQSVDIVEDNDVPVGVDEDGGTSEDREEFLLRTQELTIDLFDAQERFRSIRRLLMEHLGEELEDSAF